MRVTVLSLGGLACALFSAGCAGGRLQQEAFSQAFFENVAGLEAKILCSETYVAGRSPETVQAQELASENLHPGANLVRTSLIEDASYRGAEAVVGDTRRLAIYRGAYGCGLLPSGMDPAVFAASAQHTDSLYKRPAREIPPYEDADLRQRMQAALDRAMSEPDPEAPRRTRAILVMKDGRLVAESYAPGFSTVTPVASYSMGKALTNALIGVLVQQGALEVDAPAPIEAWKGANDPRRDITVSHLLHMSAGLAAEYQGRRDMGSRAMSALFGSINPEAYAIESPAYKNPGEEWWYSNANTFALVSIIKNIVGGGEDELRRFIETELFKPLGMEHSIIEFNAYGMPVTTSFNYLTVRDWARFGRLYLNDGVVDGRRLLPEGWVQYTGTPASSSKDASFGAHWHVNAVAARPEARAYAEDRTDRPPFDSMPEDALIALGDSGQSMIVVPSLDLIVVRLGQVRPEGETWNYRAFLASVADALRQP